MRTFVFLCSKDLTAMRIRVIAFLLWLLPPRDTVFLFPAAHYLDEVVVVGKQTVDGRGLLKKMPKRDILEKRPPSSLGGFDLGIMLDKRYRRDRRHVAQLREIFKKMDGLDDKEDPILKAYRQTQMELKADSIQKKNSRQQDK